MSSNVACARIDAAVNSGGNGAERSESHRSTSVAGADGHTGADVHRADDSAIGIGRADDHRADDSAIGIGRADDHRADMRVPLVLARLHGACESSAS